ncbi:MAG: amidohydrolase [Tissierellales bacterium]|nr:amidohydrolase [Tissierellales bacterium]
MSNKIWDYAETRFEEYKSADLLCKVLEEEGFSVEKEVADIKTAFVGSYGSEKPVIGILGEYDALSGLSQKSKTIKKEPVIEGGNGHGCGHNLLGTASLSAAISVKKYMEENNLKGTVRFYGCPGEEGGSGKTFMVREGVFKDVDVALCWHPFSQNSIFSISSLANYQVYFRFHGKSSHAAASPHLGRSALDAVELMNVGVNYLREHIIPDARVHYAVTNTGGTAPNVVQAESEVLYLIRAPKTPQVHEIYDRVCDIAKGAALMTQTKLEIDFNKGCSNLIPNKTIETLMYENFKLVGPPVFDDEDRKFAEEISQTLSESDIENEIKLTKLLTKNNEKKSEKKVKRQKLSDEILPYYHNAGILSGSTDVGDVSWVVPTGQIISACYTLGTPGHSWQLTAQGKSEIAYKGMLTAAKVMGMTALDILNNPDIVKKAKEELKENLDGEKYICPIPDDIEPSKI